MALTGKKRLFADAVLAGSSNKEAAIVAGYSAATASPAGSRLVKDLEVAAYLAVHRSPAAPAPKDVTKPTTAKKPAPSDSDAGSDYEYTVDPESFLTAAMNDPGLDVRMRIDSAKALMPYKHQKLGEGGKKDQKQDAAKTAAKGKFAPSVAPRLVHSK